ncbi:MAG: helical backbone metal receptor [Bacteroidia bacterium]|nr:helical backbone metal receptor [Bacteroidia bacterium]
MSIFIDQLGRKVHIESTPKRIVSIVPSQTELLYALGCAETVVGQTVFCVHPYDKFKNAVKIGGPKKLNIDKIIALKPDLVIANKEENLKEEVAVLEPYCPVWVSDIVNLEDALAMICSIGQICDKEHQASQLIAKIENGFSIKNYEYKHTCIYMIWRNPYMVVGGGTFINDMLSRGGFANLCENMSRYPQLLLEQMQMFNPDVVFLSSEPYPFKEKHIAEFEKIFPKSNIMLVDGEMFTWYGSRLQYSSQYFNTIKARLL